MERINTEFCISNVPKIKEQLLHWASENEIFFYLESNHHKNENSVFESAFAFGVQDFLECDVSENAFEKLQNFREKHKDFLFGFLSYDLKNDIENLHSKNEDFINIPKIFFFQPQKLIFIKDEKMIFKYLKKYEKEVAKDFEKIKKIKIPPKKTIPKMDLKSKISKKQYFEKIRKIKEKLKKGAFYEMNFCFEFYEKNKKINPLETFLALNKKTQMPFAAFVKLKNKYVLCASPERFLKKENQKITAQPIKGTAKKAKNEKYNFLLKKELLDSEKERSENTMIVDLMRNDLSKIAKKGSVQVTELCKVYSFKNVHQMISTITCQTSENPIHILKNTFPMGSMTGAPKIAAMEYIEKLEHTKRGLYSGSIGYFTPAGNFDFNVVIRSILYDEITKYISHMVGSAITIHSEAEKEYEECFIKASSVKSLFEKQEND